MIPVILSGGSGTRLWPLSRSNYPKQFLPLWGKSLFEMTLDRINDLGDPWVISHVDQFSLTSSIFERNAFDQKQIIFEPIARNTAAAVATLCHHFQQNERQTEIAGIFPADHIVKDKSSFLSAVTLAKSVAENNHIVTLGIEPTYAATGFGYLEIGEELQKGVFKTQQFHEKPDNTKANTYLNSKKHFWNAGIFVFQISTMIKEFQKQMPDLWKKIEQLNQDFSNICEVYESLPSTSLDYGIMENAKSVACIPSSFGWSDAGSWDDLLESDISRSTVLESTSAKGNSAIGKKTVAFVDTENLIVVDSADAILIAKKGSSQEVKEIVNQFKNGHKDLLRENFIDFRPWGEFEVIRDDESFKSKIIRVRPGHQLSYQSHTKRSEHWVIVNGVAEVVLDDKVFHLNVGESIFIPKGSKHRMRNATDKLLEFVEVQTGESFDEDDITRYEDDYGRGRSTKNL